MTTRPDPETMRLAQLAQARDAIDRELRRCGWNDQRTAPAANPHR